MSAFLRHARNLSTNCFRLGPLLEAYCSQAIFAKRFAVKAILPQVLQMTYDIPTLFCLPFPVAGMVTKVGSCAPASPRLKPSNLRATAAARTWRVALLAFSRLKLLSLWKSLASRLRMFVFPMLADDAVHLARFEVVISGQAKFANRTLPAIDSSLLDRRQRRQRVFEADFQLFLLIGMPSIDMSSLLVNPSFAHPSGKVTQRACPLSTLSASGRSTGCVLSFTGCTWRARTPTRSSSRRGRRILALL